MLQYSPYEIVDNNMSLAQGDFFDSCPIVRPSVSLEPGMHVDQSVVEYDVVVMSQSCDLEHEKLDLVLVCPVWTLEEFGDENDYFKSTKGKEALRRGYSPGYHLLHPCDLQDFECGCRVVDFRNVYSVHYEFLVEMAASYGDRLRLLPPYREHLSQAFARFFMRVGLPQDIPPFN